MLSVRDRASFDTMLFLLCSPGQGPAVFETLVVLGTRDGVLPQLSICPLPLLSEWSGVSETCRKRMSEACEFITLENS